MSIEAVHRHAALLARLGSFSADPSTMRFTFRDELFELWGVPPGSALREDPDVFSRDVLHPDDQPRVVAAFDEGLRTGGRHDVEFRIHRVDTGELRHVRSTVEVVLGQDGSPARITGAQVDVTDLVLARQSADDADSLHRAVLAATPDVVFVTDVDLGGPVYVSPSMRTVLGYDPAEVVRLGRTGAPLHLHPDDLHVLREAGERAQLLADGEVVQSRYRILHADGHWVWVHRRATPFQRDADGRVTQVLGVIRDVSDVVVAQERLAHLAAHDALTGLANRSVVADRLGEALATGAPIGVVYLDLDGFKRVNDLAGHATGDALLQQVAERLLGCAGPRDTVARLGGDEFVLLVPGGAERARRLAERVVAAVSEPVVVGSASWTVTASAGVALSGDASDGLVDADRMLADADLALYRAKAAGKARVLVFEPALREQTRARGRVERLLRSALAVDGHRGGLDVAYQPVCDASGRVVGVEALARLNDSVGRPVSPLQFIGIAEECGLVQRLGGLVLERALADLARWRVVPGAADLTVAVNVSAHEIPAPTFAGGVLAALTRHRLPPRALVLELTESALLEADPMALAALRGLHRAGVRIAIDDFGTGYASLRYLTELPVDEVKVDRSFTRGLPHDPVASTILRAVTGLARDLGLTCVVEGVETQEQRAALPEGVLVQGYLLGRPVSAVDLDLSPRHAVHVPLPR